MGSCCKQHRSFCTINLKRGKYNPKELNDSQTCNHKSGNTGYIMNASFFQVQLFYFNLSRYRYEICFFDNICPLNLYSVTSILKCYDW